MGAGIPEEDARTYETHVKEGRILITAQATDGRAGSGGARRVRTVRRPRFAPTIGPRPRTRRAASSSRSTPPSAHRLRAEGGLAPAPSSGGEAPFMLFRPQGRPDALNGHGQTLEMKT